MDMATWVTLDFEVTELPNGKFRCKMRVASAFFAAIIGKKAASKRRIEIETKAKVDIPRQVHAWHLPSSLH